MAPRAPSSPLFVVALAILVVTARAGVVLDTVPTPAGREGHGMRGALAPKRFSNPFAFDRSEYKAPLAAAGPEPVLGSPAIVTAQLGDSRCPDCGKTATELITQLGYPVEIHEVETADGYILEMHRIPHGKAGPRVDKDGKVRKNQPVLLQHGLLDSSATWVMQDEDDSLAFIMADQGYDVWLGNSRGNFYSRKHKKLTTNDSAYWAFSFDEMAKYDIPAVIEYVCETTGFDKINYAGHSQGTTQMFIALSTPGNPVAARLNVFNALAPIAYLTHQTSLLLSGVVNSKLADLLHFFGVNEFLPESGFNSSIGEYICGPLGFVCKTVIDLMCGEHHGREPNQNLDPARLPVFISHYPAGTSMQNMMHWAQLIASSEFQAFDYGEKKNMAVYGQVAPPVYDMSRIKDVPMAWFAGTYDDLGDPADVLRAVAKVPKELLYKFENMESYNHMDFIWGKDAGKQLYTQVVASFKKFTPAEYL